MDQFIMYINQQNRLQFRTFFLESRSSFNSMQFNSFISPMHPDTMPHHQVSKLTISGGWPSCESNDRLSRPCVGFGR